MKNAEWIDFLTEQFNVSRTSAKRNVAFNDVSQEKR